MEFFMLYFDIFPVSYPVLIVLGHLKWVLNQRYWLYRLLICEVSLREVVLKVQSKHGLIVAILLIKVVENIRANCWVA